MSTFSIKCPRCGVDLEADENDTGAMALCSECDHYFILPKSTQEPVSKNQDYPLGDKNNTEGRFEQHKPMDKLAEQFSFSLNGIPDDLTHSKPCKVSYIGTDYKLSSWKDFLREICTQLDIKFHEQLLALRGKAFAWFTKRICLRSSKQNLLCPLKIADDLWIESNFDAKTIVKLAAALLRTFEIDLASIKVVYSMPLQKKETLESSEVVEQGISFNKKLDWSTLTMGVTIPVKLHNAFLQHLSALLPRGSSMPVFIRAEGTQYRVSMVNVGFSDPTHRQVLQILWSRKSPMTEMLRMRFPAAYQQLSENHGNRDGIEDVIIVALDSDKDTFCVSFSQSNETEKTIAKNEVEKKTDPLDTIAEYSKDEIEKIRRIFNQNFQSGIRPGSIIDKNRFKRYYREETGSDLSEDFPFEALLPKVGMLHEGKVFPRLPSEDTIWRILVDELLKDGHCLLAYSRVMELHAQELMASGIASAEMLHDLIVHDAGCAFEIGSKYFAVAGSPLNLADVITASIPENTRLVSETELCRRLPYVCKEDIHRVLVSDLRYAWNCQDIYVVGNRLTFDESETDCVLSEIRRVVSSNGYCSLARFDFTESMCLNDPEITVYAVRRVFFSRYLANEFDKHGQIVSCKGEEIDGKVPLREFCRKYSEVTLQQVYAIANDFNITDYLAMTTMHEEMVRVELERFAAPSMVTFDIVSIDHVLDSCFPDKVMPLGAFRDFSQFPAVPGWSWNLYLLEAFLRRSSRKFHLLTPSAAAREVAGVVVRKDDAIDDVLDACAIVAGEAGLPNDDDAVVGDYLLKQGCILRRRASMVAEITARMKMIYDGMK